ncbi:MAG: prepilin peptidase [Clostridia bacterium]|jgi:leader peptidase (prepilin peptidase)/N-methyltransferase|nr:prepilin peptidase [Clostridia bacterium]MDH7572633.1 prepilin peptidase [Clostridia bacterium]
MLAFLILSLGVAIGSFLNVCIYRIPRGESLVFPPSHCPYCGHRLGPADLVPVLSYLWLRGRCRYCRERISPQYPLVELGTGGLFLLLCHLYGPSPELVSRLVLASGLLVAALIDARHYRIPNQVVAFLAASGVALNLWTQELAWWQVAAGAGIGGGVLAALALLSRGGMGEGDVKLAGAVGLYLGPAGAVMTLFLAAALGAIIGGLLILLGRRGRKEPIPFAPFLAVAAVTVHTAGETLWQFYLSWAGWS